MLNNWLKNIDLQLLLIYVVLVLLGITSIYSTTYDENYSSIFSFNKSYGKQIMWFGISLCIGIIILLLDIEFIRKYIEVFYAITILLLVFYLSHLCFVVPLLLKKPSWFGFPEKVMFAAVTP